MSSSGRAAAHGSRNSAETLANAEALAPTVNNAAFALDSMKHLFTMAAVGLDSLLSRIPYSVHMEFWSGGNPSCAIIVVQWTGIINRQTTQKLQDGDKQHNEDVGKFEGADEDVPSAWGISASEWTNRGSDVFHKNSKATSGPGSAPSSPRLGSVAVHGSASPRFPASIGSSPRIRPTTGWSTPVSPGGTMNRAASYTGNSPSHQHHSNALGGRRTTVNKSGGNLIVSASLPGTPAISSSSKYSPFFGPVSGSAARASRSSGIQPWNEDGEEADGDDYFAKEKGSPSIFRPAMSSNDGRGRSASITSIPEISLGAAAISMRSHSITGTGPAETTGRGDSSGAAEQEHRKHKRRIGSSSLTAGGRTMSRVAPRRWPVAMHRLPVTYAALIHYLCTVISLRALLLAVQGQGSSGGSWQGPLLSSVLCGMSLDARGRAENLGLRRSSLAATVVLFLVVLNLSCV